MRELIESIHLMMKRIKRPLRLMEVCGTHTVSIFRHGIRAVLPEEISFLSGPGCPVCVTSLADLDRVIALSSQPDTILTTFGDMMRVPGSRMNLQEARAGGADVRVVYSPMEALSIAARNPGRRVVFFATGFETTSPVVAATLKEADRRGIGNFHVYTNHKLVPPALQALLADDRVRVDGFILPGHVSVVIGSRPYEFISRDHGRPAVIAGFEAGDIIESVALLLAQILSGRAAVEIQYRRAVRTEGNTRALSLVDSCFRVVDAQWRGLGIIEESGLSLREELRHRDVPDLPDAEAGTVPARGGCRCGDVLRGISAPPECPLFGAGCTPEKPVGACMVSSEGSCASYYRYGPA